MSGRRRRRRRRKGREELEVAERLHDESSGFDPDG